MDKFEKIAKALREIENKIVLMEKSHEGVPIQKIPDGARKRLFHILLAFLAGVCIAGFTAYNYFVDSARTEIINKFNEEELPNIKQEIMAAVVKEASGVLPEVQSRLESNLNSRLELLMKRSNSQTAVPVEDPGKRQNQKLVSPTQKPVLDPKATEERSTQQGWSFYGIRLERKWVVKYFYLNDEPDVDPIPIPGVTIVAKGYVDIRKESPSYTPDAGWNYALAAVIGGVRKSERAKVNQVTSVETPRGKYVWVNLSPIQR